MRANISETGQRLRITPDMVAAQFMGDQMVARNKTTKTIECPVVTPTQPIAPKTTEHVITLPRFGLRVAAPLHTARVMEMAQQHKQEGTRYTEAEKATLWPVTERLRLKIMGNCAILKKRYPTPEAGKRYMQDVDPIHRDRLLKEAAGLTLDIVSEWQKVNPQKDIAVLLFGSVAKGLVKRPDHPDPSNVDLAVIGEITDEEREALLNGIRPAREKLREAIVAQVPVLDSQERNPGNAGVMVQNMTKLRNGEYYATRNYIASGAFPMYDPTGIWSGIEQEALNFAAEKAVQTQGHRKSRFGVPVFTAPRSSALPA